MFKLQLGCIMFLLFIAAVYFTAKRKKSYSHILFSVSLGISMFNFVFDVATVYTVNHLYTVPVWVNRVCHILFLGSMIAEIFVCYLYSASLIYGDDAVRRKRRYMAAPVCGAWIGLFLLPIDYVETPQGNYSWGPATFLVYGCTAFYMVCILAVLIWHWHEIDPKKRRMVMIAFGVQAAVMLYQGLHPAALITSGGITLINLAFFLTVESPDVLLMERLKAEKERADEANEAKSRFLSNMSHEVRTPINTVLGLDTMILRESRDDTIKKYAMNIQSAGQSLLSIINDLLDFSRIESGKMELICVDYDLSSMISDVTNMISNKAERKGLKFIANIDCNMPNRLYGDDVRIRQVLINLLTNAVKYTHKGSVTLTITGHVVEDELHMFFSVKDTGIGIKAEDIQKLNSEFVRIEEKRNRHIEGTGLGINIVTQLLKLMNSELVVDSMYGVGSDFYFQLVQKIVNPEPIGDLDTRIRQQATEYSYDVSYVIPEVKLLVVDDNAMNRMVFMNLLKNLKCEIHEADSGRKCLELVKSYKYDIIFMDHMMPEMDGVETLHALQEMPGNLSKDCKVICLTANAVSGAKQKYLSEGFDDFLSKPIVPDKLEKLIFHFVPDQMIQEVESDIIETTNAEQKKQTENQDIGEILESLPKIDGVDWNYAWLHLPKKELLESTLKTFYQTIHTEADYLADMYERIHSDEGDSEAMELFRIKVHAMKSAATLIGALPLAGTAAMLEFASRDGERQLVLEVTPYFLEKWRSFKGKLQEIVEPEGSESKEKIEDKGDVIAYLEQLILAVNNFDVYGADSALEHLQIYDYPSELKDLLDKIAGAVQNLDTENVDKLGKQMIDKMQEE